MGKWYGGCRLWAAAEFRMLLDRALSSPLAHVFQGHPTVGSQDILEHSLRIGTG